MRGRVVSTSLEAEDLLYSLLMEVAHGLALAGGGGKK